MKKFLVFTAVLGIILGIPSSYAFTEGTNKKIKTNSVISDELDTYDEIDYFNFSISKPGSIKINFEFDIEGKYNVKLINRETNKVIQNITFSSSVNTTTGRYEQSTNKMRLADGEYQISVSSNTYSFSDEEYEFEVEYDAESGDRYEKEPNNTAKESMILDYNKDVTGNLESSYDTDYYMVELERAGTFQIQLQYDYNAKYNVAVYSESNGLLSQIQNSRFAVNLNPGSNLTTQVADKLRVDEGNYYVKIVSGGSFSDNDYRLRILYYPEVYGNFEKEPNNDAKNATEIYFSQSITGNLSASNDADYYMFNTWGSDKVYLNMQRPLNAEYTVTLYKEQNGNLSQIKYIYVTDKTENYIPLDVDYGTYYLKVAYRKYSNEDYILTILNSNEVHIGKKLVLEINKEYMEIDGLKVKIDNELGITPIVVNGRTLLPMRAIIEALGGTANWDENSNSSIFTLGNNTIQMPIGTSIAYVNGYTKYLDVANQVINGRTMSPVRFIMENLGGQVIWDEVGQKVTIEY